MVDALLLRIDGVLNTLVPNNMCRNGEGSIYILLL